MKPSLRQQFERLALRLNELDASLGDAGVAVDMNRYRALSREHAEVSDVLALYNAHQQREQDLREAHDMLDSAGQDDEIGRYAADEVEQARADIERLERQLQTALLPRDPDDGRNAFLEIRAGTGGDESALFAADLARMYLRHAERRGWRTEVMSESASDLGGYKELVLRIDGDDVYAALKFESGGHRVQRIPVTETQGRIHTSACTVAVLPEPDAAQEVALEPGRPAHRHLPCQRRRRAARQQDRQRDPRHPPADRTGGRVPGRPLAAPQQGQGAGGAGGAPARPRTGRTLGTRSGHAQGTDRQRRPQRPHPHLQLPAGTADRSPHQPHAVPAAGDPRR